MIPGLLDSQIRTMSGRELAERLFEVVDDETSYDSHVRIGRFKFTLKMQRRSRIPTQEMQSELARIIDDIRAADSGAV